MRCSNLKSPASPPRASKPELRSRHPCVLAAGLITCARSGPILANPHSGICLLLQVLEYSELDPATASATNPATGTLYYNWSNICMHYFSVPWLVAAAQHLRTAAVYHIAHKQIPAKGGVKVPGLKLEMFIFDPFHTADKTTLFEVGAAAALGLLDCAIAERLVCADIEDAWITYELHPAGVLKAQP